MEIETSRFQLVKARKVNKNGELAKEINSAFKLPYWRISSIISKIGYEATNTLFREIMKNPSCKSKVALFLWSVAQQQKDIIWLETK